MLELCGEELDKVLFWQKWEAHVDGKTEPETNHKCSTGDDAEYEQPQRQSPGSGPATIRQFSALEGGYEFELLDFRASDELSPADDFPALETDNTVLDDARLDGATEQALQQCFLDDVAMVLEWYMELCWGYPFCRKSVVCPSWISRRKVNIFWG